MSEAVAIDPIDIRICEYFNALTEEEKQRFIRSVINNPQYHNTKGQFRYELLESAIKQTEIDNDYILLNRYGIEEKLSRSYNKDSIRKHTATLEDFDRRYTIIFRIGLSYFMLERIFNNFRQENRKIKCNIQRFCSTIQNICMTNATTNSVASDSFAVASDSFAVASDDNDNSGNNSSLSDGPGIEMMPLKKKDTNGGRKSKMRKSRKSRRRKTKKTKKSRK
jgi:hypothetical protein